MPFTIDPQPGEEVYLQREFRGSHDHVFAMAVSNQAVYVSAQKLALKRDPWYFKRVPLNEVEEVRLVKQRPVYVLLLGLVMILFWRDSVVFNDVACIQSNSGRRTSCK